jgi:hypothetical protein
MVDDLMVSLPSWHPGQAGLRRKLPVTASANCPLLRQHPEISQHR